VTLVWPAAHPSFSTAGAAIALLLAAYSAIAGPLLGRRSFRRLTRRRAAGDTRILTRYYLVMLVTQWGWTLLIAVILLVDPGLRPSDLGIQMPEASMLPGSIAFVAYFLLVLGISVVVIRRRARSRPVPRGVQAISGLLPRTPRERWLAGAVAVSAGICEELLFRGLLIAVAAGVLGLPIGWALVAALAAFVFDHVYQGPRAMVGIAAMGALFSATYAVTGSLLPGMVVHAAVDLRGLVVLPWLRQRAGAAGALPEADHGRDQDGREDSAQRA
jgi:membrane protease YdiL (CAAX protease family)